MISRNATLCACLAGLFWASQAWADCVGFDSFAKGVEVKLADGGIWVAQRGAHDVIRVDQRNAEGVYAKYEIGPYGVYITEGTRNGIGTTAEYRYSKAVKPPHDGFEWHSNFKVNSIPAHDSSRQQWQGGQVQITGSDARAVTIAGCAYEVIAVDVARTARERTTVVHYAYFPALRFGIQTRISYQDGTVKEAGIVGMRPL